MKISKLFIFLLLALGYSFAQKADYIAAKRWTSTEAGKLIGSTSVRANWIKDHDAFWYTYSNFEGTDHYYVDAEKKVKKLLFDRAELHSQLSEITRNPINPSNLPIKNLEFKKKSKVDLTFEVDSLKFEYNVDTRKLAIIDTIKAKVTKEKAKKDRKDSWKSYSPDSTMIAFAKNHNLYLMKANDKDSVEIQLTTDGEKYYSFGGSDEDSLKNKRQRPNVSWFKDSKKLYVTRSDSRKVKDLWVINTTAKPRPLLETYRYSMAGDEFVPQNELIVFDVATKKRLDVNLKKWKDQGLSPQTIKSSDEMFVIRNNRKSSEFDICKVNTTSGEVKVLFSEKSEPVVVDVAQDLYILNEGKDFVWYSERDGWGHYYHFDANGKLANRMTKGQFVVGRPVIDSTKNVFYFPANGGQKDISPYYNLYYKVDINGNGFKLLTPEDATHGGAFSDSRKYFVDTYSRIDLEPCTVLRDSEGKIVMQLEKTDISKLIENGWKKPIRLKLKANDGVTDIYGDMVLPFNFDSTRKYPIVTYVYPGPQQEPFSTSFSPTLGDRLSFAQLGFIVVAVGNRGGSPQRDKWYHTWGYGNARDYPLEDNKYALEQLARKYSFIDITKVGMWGHSGGGNMTAAALFKFPDFYKVGVSQAGNHDNNIYNTWWGETHYGIKEVKKKVATKDTKDTKGEVKTDKKDEAEEYEEEDFTPADKEVDEYGVSFVGKYTNNPEVAANLKGRLLIIHGEIDNNVHPGNSIRVIDALIKAGKKFDMYILPGQRHGFSGVYGRFAEQMRWRYFSKYLLGDDSDDIEVFDNHNK